MKKSIPTCKIDDFNKRLSSINNKLVKYGKPKLEVKEVERYVRWMKYKTHEGEWSEMQVEFADLEIDGIESFKRDDKEYRYIGSIQYNSGIKQISCLDEAYLEYFDRDYNVCDHCHTNRIRNSYKLFESNGEVIQIGSTCAKDYFGYDINKYLDIYLVLDAIEKEYDDFGKCGGSMVRTFNDVYNVICNITADFSKWQKAERDPYTGTEYGSVYEIRMNLFDIDTIKNNKLVFNDVEDGILDRVRDYWKKQERNSFVLNVNEALKTDYATYNSIGFYSFAIFKAMQEIRKEDAKKDGKMSSYKNGDRPTLNVTVVDHKIIRITSYGYRGGTENMAIVKFITDDGIRYMTKSTGFDVVHHIKVGDKLTIKGAVYGTDRYDNLCTILGRVKIVR